MYRCKKCKKEFPVVAWIEATWFTTTPLNKWTGPGQTIATIESSNQSSTWVIKKPCCPFCHEIELEEIFAVKKLN
jgi:hypothetical protein